VALRVRAALIVQDLCWVDGVAVRMYAWTGAQVIGALRHKQRGTGKRRRGSCKRLPVG
jgi:hypothetical protein